MFTMNAHMWAKTITTTYICETVTIHHVDGNAHIWAKNGENLLSKCSCITHTLRFLKNIFAVFIAKSERSGQYKAKGGE